MTIKQKKQKSLENKTVSKLKSGLLSRLLTKFSSSIQGGENLDNKLQKTFTILSNMKSIQNKAKATKPENEDTTIQSFDDYDLDIYLSELQSRGWSYGSYMDSHRSDKPRNDLHIYSNYN